MRTDQLLIGSTNIAIAHILSAAAALGGAAFIVYGHIKAKKQKTSA